MFLLLGPVFYTLILLLLVYFLHQLLLLFLPSNLPPYMQHKLMECEQAEKFISE